MGDTHASPSCRKDQRGAGRQRDPWLLQKDENTGNEEVVEERQAGRRTATSSPCEVHFKLRNVALLAGTADVDEDTTRSLQSTSTSALGHVSVEKLSRRVRYTPAVRALFLAAGRILRTDEEHSAYQSTPKSPRLPCADASYSTHPLLRHTAATFLYAHYSYNVQLGGGVHVTRT